MGDPLRDWDEPGTGVRTARVLSAPTNNNGDRPGATSSEGSNAPTMRPPEAAPLESRIPVLVIDRAQLLRLPLDARAGFLLSLMDGATTVESLLDVCCMPTDTALRLLDELRLRGVIALM